ncbi:RNA-binding protein 48-like [Lissotriton helveticus]
MESETSGQHQQVLQVCGHHAQRAACRSRAKYREGRRPKAVRVYTINLESRYLMVQGVPAIGVMNELIEHFALFGTIEEYHALDEYPAEEFTEVYLIKFHRLHSARVAKRKLDERSFFGGVLHVCYAPEFETVQETREKLQDRRKYIARATSNKDCFVEKKHDPKCVVSREFGPQYQRGPSVSSTTEAEPCASLYQQTSYPFDSSLSQVLATNTTVAFSHDHLQTALRLPQCTSDNNNTSCDQTHFMQDVQQIVNPSNNAVNRFMPRTTQLQERKRKRDEGSTYSLFGTDTEGEMIIGPKLPEIPKVDMEDESLNFSANTIRSKLKKVSSMAVQNTEVKQKEDHPVKPRRRI